MQDTEAHDSAVFPYSIGIAAASILSRCRVVEIIEAGDLNQGKNYCE